MILKIKYLEYGSNCAIMAFNEDEICIGTVTVDINCDDYPRYKEYCNSDKLAKIVGVETKPSYVGKGIATRLLNEVIKKFGNYNLVLLCSPRKRVENTDTLKTPTDLQIFYSKFGFFRTNELLPTMIRKANI